MHAVLELLQNRLLDRVFAVGIPFLLKQLVPMTSVAQAEPRAVLRSIQVPRRIDPYPAGCRTPHREHTERRFPFLEFPDRFLPRRLRLHYAHSPFNPRTPPPPPSSHPPGYPPPNPSLPARTVPPSPPP